jgi:hypothetical protein
MLGLPDAVEVSLTFVGEASQIPSTHALPNQVDDPTRTDHGARVHRRVAAVAGRVADVRVVRVPTHPRGVLPQEHFLVGEDVLSRVLPEHVDVVGRVDGQRRILGRPIRATDVDRRASPSPTGCGVRVPDLGVRSGSVALSLPHTVKAVLGIDANNRSRQTGHSIVMDGLRRAPLPVVCPVHDVERCDGAMPVDQMQHVVGIDGDRGVPPAERHEFRKRPTSADAVRDGMVDPVVVVVDHVQVSHEILCDQPRVVPLCRRALEALPHGRPISRRAPA